METVAHKTTWHYVQKICIHMLCLPCRKFSVTVTRPWFFDGIEPRVRSGPSVVRIRLDLEFWGRSRQCCMRRRFLQSTGPEFSRVCLGTLVSDVPATGLTEIV